jgi:hypothetical protein
MGRQAKTQQRLDVAIEVLTEHHPMTVRQVYYQLVSRQVVENSRGMYQAVSDLLVQARKEGIIPWEWIEDRLRRPLVVPMWENLADFAETAVSAYRRNVWATQPAYLEVWLEKDALSGFFQDALDAYGVTCNVGRGDDGWSSIHNAGERYQDEPNVVTVLYFGDFDPSGEDMVRSLQEWLGFFWDAVEIIKCALTMEDIAQHQLPPDFTKTTDTRRAAFVAKYGDVAVELDALPVDVLVTRLISEVEARMDLDALAAVHEAEEEDRSRLREILENLN